MLGMSNAVVQTHSTRCVHFTIEMTLGLPLGDKMHELLESWRRFPASAAPHLLAGDDVFAEPTISKRWAVVHSGWDDFIQRSDFRRPDHRVHLGLLPAPFTGSLENATVVILMLNPGLHPADYFAEYKVHEYREALLSNLRQSRSRSSHPNIFLDPEYSWHSGFTYWYGKLRRLIEKYAREHGCSSADSLRVFAQSIAFLQLYPYHSESFGLPHKIKSKLKSAKLARSYAHEVLLPRAQQGRLLIVVARQAEAWELSKKSAEPNVIEYSRAEARGAHLTPKSRGGGAILQQLVAAATPTRQCA